MGNTDFVSMIDDRVTNLHGKTISKLIHCFLDISAGKNSGSGQIRVGQFGQCQNSDEKLMSDTRFFSGRTMRTRVNSGQNRVRTIEM